MTSIHHQRGTTFIEILISSLVVSYFLISLVRLELLNYTVALEAYLKTIAIIQASNGLMLFKMFSPSTHQTNLVYQWESETRALLPHAKSDYNCNNNQCNIRISWRLKKKQDVQLKR